MKVEEGYLIINGTDMATYGCMLYEENATDHTNYDSLMRAPKMKDYTFLSYRELDGEEFPETVIPRCEARDISLKMAIVADTRTQWYANYKAVLALLKSGWLTLSVPEINMSFKVLLKEYTKYRQFTTLRSTGQQVAGFTVVFHEPKPFSTTD